jgi:outer membrane protein OmpA-like peptidoglycan-associated protein
VDKGSTGQNEDNAMASKREKTMEVQKVITIDPGIWSRAPRGLWPRLTSLALSIFLTTVAEANVVGSETQNFNPTSNGMGFITVQGSETIPVGYFNLGLFLDHAINTLPVFESIDGEQSRSVFNDYITTAHFHAGMGITENWDLGLSLPNVIAEKVSGKQDYHGEFLTKGLISIDANSKYRVWHHDNMGIAVIGSVNFNQLQNNPYLGSGAGPTYNLELAGDIKVGENLFAANLGHRWHSAGEALDPNSPIQPVGNEFIWSGASSIGLSPINAIIVEIFGSSQLQGSRNDSDRKNSADELDVGYKHLVSDKEVALNAGMGTELTHGKSTPDWRLFAGINWTFGPKKTPEPVKIEKPVVLEKAAPPVIEGPLGPVMKEEAIVVHDILFKFNSDKLVLKGQNTSIFKLERQLMAGPGFKSLTIEGHTDSIGTDSYNQKLSSRRAKTIKDWLVKNYKIDPRKIRFAGRGEAVPLDTNNTDVGRQKNRRVEFKISR